MHTDSSLFLVLFLAFMVAHLVICYLIGRFAESKGQSFWLGFLLTFFTSPLIAFLIVGLSGDRRLAR